MLPAPARVLAVLFRFGAAWAAGVMTGNRPAAFPAAMTRVMVRFMSAAGIAAAGDRPAALMIIPVVLVMAGIGPGGSAVRGPAVPAAPTECAGEARADGARDADRAGLVLDEGDRVGLALRVGDGDAEWVTLALTDGDAEWVALAVGDGDAEWVGVALMDGDGEWVALALADDDGVAEGDGDSDVDGDADVVEGDGEADVAGDDERAADGRGVLEAGETGFASAVSWTPADRPQTRRPSVNRTATTTRAPAGDLLVIRPAPPAWLAGRAWRFRR